MRIIGVLLAAVALAGCALKGNLSLGARPGDGGPVRVFFGIRTPAEEGERDAVERRAAVLIAQHQKEARAAIDAFSLGAGWTIDTAIEWDKAMLHGDC